MSVVSACAVLILPEKVVCGPPINTSIISFILYINVGISRPLCDIGLDILLIFKDCILIRLN